MEVFYLLEKSIKKKNHSKNDKKYNLKNIILHLLHCVEVPRTKKFQALVIKTPRVIKLKNPKTTESTDF